MIRNGGGEYVKVRRLSCWHRVELEGAASKMSKEGRGTSQRDLTMRGPAGGEAAAALDRGGKSKPRAATWRPCIVLYSMKICEGAGGLT